MNLCLLTSVKRRCAIELADTADDVILAAAIGAIGQRFNKFCNRDLDRAADATYDFSAEQKFVLPPRYPIESVASWKLKTSEGDGWETQTGVEYLIRRGTLLELAAPLGAMTQIGRVTYTGGYVLPGTTPGTGQTALPDEINQAAVEQAVYWYQNRNRLGLTSVSGQGVSLNQFADLDLLPSVKEALRPHVRMLL